MKKYIRSTICSALIVPGMGQALNGQFKKGLILMGIVFVILIAVVIKTGQIILDILPGLSSGEINVEGISEEIDVIKIYIMDNSIMRIIIFVFLIIWIYSIIDAFITGIKIEKEGN